MFSSIILLLWLYVGFYTGFTEEPHNEKLFNFNWWFKVIEGSIIGSWGPLVIYLWEMHV